MGRGRLFAGIGLFIGLTAIAGGGLARRHSPPGKAPSASPAQEHVLRVVPVRPPGSVPRVLCLTAEDLAPRQPRRSHLYLVDPGGSHPPRSLSPEPGYNFWDASAGDVDGDGREEVALCTYSATARDPRLARRFFVYGWDAQDDLYPRWRGSRLCRPYVTAQLADMAGDRKAELLSVEVAPDGGRLLVAYQWNQFGFWGLGHSPVYAAAQVLRPACRLPDGRKGVEARVTPFGGEPREVVFTLQGGSLRPVP